MNSFEQNILFIAPLPPPITGHSYISNVLRNYLSKKYKVNVIDLSKNSTNKGKFSFKRAFSICEILYKTLIYSFESKSIYLTISESLLGNLKDLLIFLILFRKINKLVLHLHGGSIDKLVLKKYFFLRIINNFFYKKVAFIIISGNSHKSIFHKVNNKRLLVIPNFAPKNHLVNKTSVTKKFQTKDKLNLLFLSSMEKSKGYEYLLNEIEKMPESLTRLFDFNFAGSFRDKKEKEIFEKKINACNNITYHGFVDEYEKFKLYKKAHIFCLPTQLMEGQPISILEAYASGCCIITTNKPGIMDIFENGKNGYLIKNSKDFKLENILKMISTNKKIIGEIGIKNYEIAEEFFKKENFCKEVENSLVFPNQIIFE